MVRGVQAAVVIGICACGLTMSISDYLLRRARRSDVTLSQIGIAPFRWYREELFLPESRWLARTARRACAAMFVLFGLLVIVGA